MKYSIKNTVENMREVVDHENENHDISSVFAHRREKKRIEGEKKREETGIEQDGERQPGVVQKKLETSRKDELEQKQDNPGNKTQDEREKEDDRQFPQDIIPFAQGVGEVQLKRIVLEVIRNKARSGENVKLKELLDEAVERAKKVVEQKNPELSADKKEQIAGAVGIGAVKYADFSNNRTSDYVFSFDKMLAMDGNTAPYMQYAYARIKSIERNAQSKDVDIETELADVDALNLSEPEELDLAKYLIRYGESIQAAVADYRPNYLTTYLYELAQKFSAFYTNCPVLKAGPDKRPSRLLLCDLTARTIRHGLSELLGIKVVEQM